MLISGRQRKVLHLNMIYDGTESVEGGTDWYLVLLGQYDLVLLEIKWDLDDMRILCLYILKKAEIRWGVTIAGQTNEQTRKDRATQPWKAGMSKDTSNCQGQ